MNWNQLQYVLMVRDEKSISKAAEKLYISQPSLSQSIKNLEEEFGVSLFERKYGEQHLTYAGEIFCDWAMTTLNSQRRMQEMLFDISGNKRQLIKIGISPHRSQILMPEVLERFYKVYPKCEILLTELPTNEMREMLENGDVDMILDTPHNNPLKFENEKLAEEKIMLAIPDEFLKGLSAEKTGNGVISLSLLEGMPFILSNQNQVIGTVSRNICRAHQFQPSVRLTCSSIENAILLCSRQMGIVFVPEIFSKSDEYTGKISFFSIEGSEYLRDICMVYSRQKYLTEPMLYVMKLFREVIGNVYR